MNSIWLTIREFLTSKKLIVAVVGIVIAAAGRYGLDLDPEAVEKIVYVVAAYLVGQGIADHGKSAAKVEAVARVVTEDAHLNTADTVEAIKTA